jgi:uncharacterized repeat protein (TIGR02543 family)
VTVTATPATGFDFAGWTGALAGVTNPATIKILGDTAVTANFIPHGSGGSGTILREFWLNVTGGTIDTLTSSTNYPNNPSGSEQLTSLEGPTNAADNYGARIRGYIHPPISGAYTFWLGSDDYGNLLLSTNDNPANATRIAFVEGWTNPREWTKYPSQMSATVNLVAGQKYYIEVVHKESTGGDSVSVAWQGPGIAQAVIAGNYLSPFVVTGGGSTGGGATNQALTVATAGTGTGTITSSPAGITCGATCTASFASGASVTLTATAASGSTFAGWSGACTGTGTCAVPMTVARSVTATFNAVGSGTTTPCANPISFTGNTGGFNTAGAVCYRTSATINGWGCSSFDGRTVSVGGVTQTCGQMPLIRSADGFTYFTVTAGAFPWAALFYW